ncbi:uncharacterized protein LOC130495758 [Raphanus sativus]|uniref:Uncharacterized protein LOC130495758 n=1 Tax=Raphanus sativus TaxID=3726 RepID=A0A9W3BVM2_RAPSA|nr:uncharacterized protein LOC130495758 [Raphanus sativus]
MWAKTGKDWTGKSNPGVQAWTGMPGPGRVARACRPGPECMDRGECMNLRSRGSSSLVPRVEDIAALERELVRKRREEEQQVHLQRLGFDMENLTQQEAAQAGIGQGGANLRPQRQPQHPPRQARAIGAYDQPHINDPFDHLDKFDSYCGLSKTNGVSEDALKLRLFPFSLGDKARQWEKSLPSDSITTWDECKEAFLDKFFSISRTAKIRNEIYGFQQRNLESFSEAWEMFKGYQAHCPHHGFSKESLLSTFYRGAIPQCRNRLDTASNGFFLGRTEEEAEELVENMAKSDSVYSEGHDRANRGDDHQTKRELKSLQDKLDFILSTQAKQEQMNFVGGPSQEAPPKVNEVDGLEGQEELCFINSNSTWYKKEPNFQYNKYQPRQNTPPSFGNNNNQSTQAQGNSSQATATDSSMESMFKQIMDAQSRLAKDIGHEFQTVHSKIDTSYTELNNKFLLLASRFNALESQVASMPSSSKSPMGSLLGKPDKNPKESCNVVISTTSSKIELSDHEKEVDEIERLLHGT